MASADEKELVLPTVDAPTPANEKEIVPSTVDTPTPANEKEIVSSTVDVSEKYQELELACWQFDLDKKKKEVDEIKEANLELEEKVLPVLLEAVKTGKGVIIRRYYSGPNYYSKPPVVVVNPHAYAIKYFRQSRMWQNIKHLFKISNECPDNSEIIIDRLSN